MQIRDELSMLRYRSGNTLLLPDGHSRADRRLPARRRAVSQPVAARASSRIARASASRYPSNAVDAAGLLRTAIRCDDPVLFLEHKHLYRQTYNKGAYPGTDFMIPFGKAEPASTTAPTSSSSRGARSSSGRCWPPSRPARRRISVAVLDLRTIVPYDWDAIAAHVRRTNRVVVAHEDQLTCGFGAEIAARIAGELFDHLDAPVRRVGALDMPVAYRPDLEEAILPQSADVLKAIRETARY